MRAATLIAVCLTSVLGAAQNLNTDDALLARVRALYDAPFQRGLINFDCSVNFDQRRHFIDTFGAVPAAAAPIAERLSTIHYRMAVDFRGAVVSAQKKVDLSDLPRAIPLEQTNRQIFQAGLATWLPYAAGEILPLAPTGAHFEKTPAGYTLSMEDKDFSGTLRLDDKYRLLGGMVEKPQHMEFTTEFTHGANGLLLADITTNTGHSGDATFRYTYQAVNGFEIPASVTVIAGPKLSWNYTLTDCKTQHGIAIKLGLPKS